jgi:hypothetical protein
MSLGHRILARGLVLGLLLSLCISTALTQQPATGRLRGQVKDVLGGLILGATVTLTDQTGSNNRTATTDEAGNYTFANLAPGKYLLRATAHGFAVYEQADVAIEAGRSIVLDIQLSVVLEKQEEVRVDAETPLGLDEQNRADVRVLRGQEVEALPDDPDELAAALQALAGPAVGPNGGQILVDGFEGGRTPPRGSIREIRFNDNPLAAERDQPSFGGIQIITKPGAEKFHGSLYTAFTDESLNSRNPFAPRREPFQFRQLGGNVSGSLRPKRDSFFLDFERNETDDNDIVNATVLDPLTFSPVAFILPVVTPTRNTTFSPRFDLQINPNNTLVARYSYLHTTNRNLGVGGFSLPSRAYEASRTQQTVQITETAVLNSAALNETRVQFIHGRRQQKGDDSVPAIEVQEAFINGGSQINLSFTEDTRFELTNITTLAQRSHSIRFGGRLRAVHLKDVLQNNFGGTFIYSGAFAPQLQFDANNLVVRDSSGNPVLGPTQQITSIERYRRTILLQSQGFTPAQVFALGGGPSQYTVNGGNPTATVNQFDAAAFVQDEWRWRPNFTITAGVRYETQNNIHSPFNFAPRLFFGWAPRATAKQPAKVVIRGGFGIFYERFNEVYTAESRHFGSDGQFDFIVTDPTILGQSVFTLNGVSNVPALQSLVNSQLRTTRIIPSNLESPYSMTGGLLVERQLPHKFILSSGYIFTRTRHSLRSRNINAPLPGTFVQGVAGSGVFPYGNVGPIYAFESSGVQNVNQLQVGIQNRLRPSLTITASYSFLRATGNSGGPISFPSNSYDLSSENGRANFEVRHRFNLTGNIGLPFNLLLNPIIIASTGRPFNIITGRDNNGDGLFTDRPAFASSSTRPADFRSTPFGDFDINPAPGTKIIPRNFGSSPGFISVNLRLSRQFKFGGAQGSAAAPTQGGAASPVKAAGPGGAGQGDAARRPPNSGGGGAPAGGSRPADKPYTLTFSVAVQNLFNRANLAPPIGNLSSSFFGQSLSSFGGGFGGSGSPAAGNRRIQASIRFNF